MKKTDHLPIQYHSGLSAKERRLCRKIIVDVSKCIHSYELVAVACSGGLDSTVLAHAVGQATRISPYNHAGQSILTTAIYVNHHLRPTEVGRESRHVAQLASLYLGFVSRDIDLNIVGDTGIQEQAREKRYAALVNRLGVEAEGRRAVILTAHHGDDNAETKLFSFLRGGEAKGIESVRHLKERVFLARPLLNFSRSELEIYAKSFNLGWCEDSSNATDKYSRNKIRHHLIPWIESNINPGFSKMINGG